MSKNKSDEDSESKTIIDALNFMENYHQSRSQNRKRRLSSKSYVPFTNSPPKLTRSSISYTNERELIKNFTRDIQERFTNFNEIGRGAFGTVYSFFDTARNQTFAIKKIQKSRLALTDLLLEIKNLLKIKEHCSRYLLCFDDVYEDDEHYYIITDFYGEYVSMSNIVPVYDSTSFDDRDSFNVDNVLPITPSIYPTYRQIFTNLINGLKQMHRLNIGHSDIKPDNVLVKDVNIKYIDFGLACSNETTCRRGGTYNYMSPTKLLALANNFSTWTLNDQKKDDIWSLGLTIYILISGRNPYFLAKNNMDLPENFERTKNKATVLSIRSDVMRGIPELDILKPLNILVFQTFRNIMGKGSPYRLNLMLNPNNPALTENDLVERSTPLLSPAFETSSGTVSRTSSRPLRRQKTEEKEEDLEQALSLERKLYIFRNSFEPEDFIGKPKYQARDILFENGLLLGLSNAIATNETNKLLRTFGYV